MGSEKPWHQRTSPRHMGGSRASFCASLANSSSTGPSIQMPRLICGGRHLRRRSSLSSTAFSSALRPPPPYSFGHCGQNQPLSRIRSNHRRASSLGNSTLLAPQTISPSGIAVRCDGGQLSCSQVRVACLNCSIALIHSPKRDVIVVAEGHCPLSAACAASPARTGRSARAGFHWCRRQTSS
ncbi:hypothetical protein D3C75_988800 [compost metagenome]